MSMSIRLVTNLGPPYAPTTRRRRVGDIIAATCDRVVRYELDPGRVGV